MTFLLTARLGYVKRGQIMMMVSGRRLAPAGNSWILLQSHGIER